MIANSRSVPSLRAKTKQWLRQQPGRTRPPLCRHLLVRVSQLGMRAPGGLRSRVHFGRRRHLVRAPGSCSHSPGNPIATSRCISTSAHLSDLLMLGGRRAPPCPDRATTPLPAHYRSADGPTPQCGSYRSLAAFLLRGCDPGLAASVIGGAVWFPPCPPSRMEE